MTQRDESAIDSSEQVPRPWRLLSLLAVAQLMLVVDVTVVALALPQMQAHLDLSREEATWAVSIYALTFGGFLLLGGKAADLYGSRRVLLIGLTVFSLASLATGFAADPFTLLGGRALQGLGAAAMSPAALSIVVRTFRGPDLAKALGVWSALGGAGAAMGVVLGGVLASGPGWSWVFWVNVPIGVALFAALARSAPRIPPVAGRLDWAGAALATAATGLLTVGIIEAGGSGWLSAGTILPVLLAAAAYAAFVWRQRAAISPLLDLRMLARRPVHSGLGLIFLATALMIAVFFLGTFLFQRVHAFGPLDTGLVFLPIGIGSIVGAQIGGRVIARRGSRAVGVTGLVVAAGPLAVAAGVDSMTILVIALSIAAVGLGMAFVASATSVFGAVAPHESGIASGVLSTFHEFGAATGVAAASSIAAAGLAGERLAAYSEAFWVLAVVSIVGAMLAMWMVPGKGPARL